MTFTCQQPHLEDHWLAALLVEHSTLYNYFSVHCKPESSNAGFASNKMRPCEQVR